MLIKEVSFDPVYIYIMVIMPMMENLSVCVPFSQTLEIPSSMTINEIILKLFVLKMTLLYHLLAHKSHDMSKLIGTDKYEKLY